MKRLTYLVCSVLVSGMVAAMIGWSMAAGNFLVPVIAIPLGIIVVLACRGEVDVVITDERESRIRSKAALRTIEAVVIGGAIVAIILYSYVVSVSLFPVITGKIISNDNGTNSMIISEYKSGSSAIPDNLIRSITIENLNAMNESEALAYCSFISESYQENENRGIAGMIFGSGILSLLIIYGVFYLYYRQKY